MKWTIRPISGPEAVEKAQYQNNWWRVPVLQFLAAGEPTEYYIWLTFPALVDDINTHNQLVEYFHEQGFRLEPDTYRPFPGNTLRRSLNELVTAMVEVVWYLEQWDHDVCQAYKNWRGLGKGFNVNI
jgi:hypothetical protein